MKNKLFMKAYTSFIIIALLIVPTLVFASDGEVYEIENIINKEIKEEMEEVIGDENFDPNIFIEKEEGEVFSPSIDNSVPNSIRPSINNIGIVKGGNEKAINTLATKQNKARGTVIENVSRGGGSLDPTKVPKIISDIDIVEKDNNQRFQDNPVDIRQFLTFQTSSGKIFHLIIDHEKTQDNVQLLTEVGEQDLLNMIEGPKEDKIELKEEIEPIKDIEDKEDLKIDDSKEPEKEKKSKSGLIMLLMALIVGGAGYYFKIYKGNTEDYSDDYYEDDDSEYEDEFDEDEGNVNESSEDEDNEDE